jgi:hypothetical protein
MTDMNKIAMIPAAQYKMIMGTDLPLLVPPEAATGEAVGVGYAVA